MIFGPKFGMKCTDVRLRKYCYQGSIWGGGDSGLCHFSIFDSENVSLFEKNGIFSRKKAKISSA